jgi:hypothetical protein
MQTGHWTQALVTNVTGFDSAPIPVADLNGDLRDDLVQPFYDLDPSSAGLNLALGTSSTSWNKQVQVLLTATTDVDFSRRFAANFTLNRKPDVVA